MKNIPWRPVVAGALAGFLSGILVYQLYGVRGAILGGALGAGAAVAAQTRDPRKRLAIGLIAGLAGGVLLELATGFMRRSMAESDFDVTAAMTTPLLSIILANLYGLVLVPLAARRAEGKPFAPVLGWSVLAGCALAAIRYLLVMVHEGKLESNWVESMLLFMGVSGVPFALLWITLVWFTLVRDTSATRQP